MSTSISSKDKSLPNRPTRLSHRRPHVGPDIAACTSKRTRTRFALKRRKPARTCRDMRERPASHDSISLQVQWRTGPRTRQWNELWKDLLAGLATTFESQEYVGGMAPAALDGDAPKMKESLEQLHRAEVDRVESEDSQQVAR